MWKWFLSLFGSESKVDEDETHDEEDPVVGELLNRVWRTGKITVAVLDENGVVTFEEWD